MKLSTNLRDIEVLEEEPEAPKDTIRDDEEHDQVDHDMTEPQMPIDPPKEVSLKRKPIWAHETDLGYGEIWCPRRVSQGEQETLHIFELYGTIIRHH